MTQTYQSVESSFVPETQEYEDEGTAQPTGDTERSEMLPVSVVRQMQCNLRNALSRRYAGELANLKKVDQESQKRRNDAAWKWTWRKYSEYFNDRFQLRLTREDQDYILNYVWNCGRTAGWKREVLEVDMAEVRGLLETHQWTDAICKAAVKCEEYLNDLAERTMEGKAELPKVRIKTDGSATPKSTKKRYMSETGERVREHALTKCEEAEESQDMPSFDLGIHVEKKIARMDTLRGVFKDSE
jgi:hypothetical protein